MKIATLFEKYRLRKLRNASVRSIQLHNVAQNNFRRYLAIASPRIEHLTDDNLAGFAVARRNSVAPATINRDLYCLLALWRFAHAERLVDTLPGVQLEKEPQRTPVAWTMHELRAIVDTARALPGKVGDYPANVWWTALLLVCFDTAERIGAVRSLEWPNVSLRDRWVIFPAETRKGANADSVMSIHWTTADVLEELRPYRGEVFRWPYCPGYLWTKYRAILKLAGMPVGRARGFHCLRKTTASYAAANGADPSKLLRHNDRRVTDAYIDPRIVGPTEAWHFIPWRP